jgi:hypothetical protein
MGIEEELIAQIAAEKESLGAEPMAEEMTEAPPVEAAPVYEANANLVLTLNPLIVAAIGAKVVSNTEADAKSGEGWREQAAAFLALYNNEANDAPIDDQQNMTAVGFPFFTRAVMLFKSKLFAHLFPEDRELVGIATTGPESEEDADRRRRCSMLMNMQLENVVTDYRKACDRNLDRQLIEGCVFDVWYYDAAEEKPAHRFVRADDLIVPYKHEFLQWNMGDFPRITWLKRLYRYELEALEESGYYANITKPVGDSRAIYEGADYDESGTAPGEPNDSTPSPSSEVDNRSTGQEEPDVIGQRVVYEQDCMLKLPGEKRQRKCTVCVDKASNAVLRISLCERPDMKDVHRANSDREAFQMQAEQAAAMGMPPPAEPAPPKMVPWHRWTQFPCFENPGGAYGHGIGHRVAGFNVVANKVGTRALAAMTMSLLRTGFQSRQLKGNGSYQELTLGKVVESPLTPEQVQNGNGMFFLQFLPPDPQWFKIVDQMDTACQELTAYNIAGGGQGLSGDTATTTEIRNTNATDNISSVGTRYQAARAQSLWNLAYLNSQTIPDEGAWIGDEKVTKEDFQQLLGDMRIVFSCDPRVDSQSTRERRAMKVLQTVTQILTTPIGDVPALDPETSTHLIRAVAVNALKEMGVSQELYQKIIDAPMPNMGPPTGAEAPPGMDGGTPPNAEMEPLQGEEINGQPSQTGMDQSAGDRPIAGPLG